MKTLPAALGLKKKYALQSASPISTATPDSTSATPTPGTVQTTTTSPKVSPLSRTSSVSNVAQQNEEESRPATPPDTEPPQREPSPPPTEVPPPPTPAPEPKAKPKPRGRRKSKQHQQSKSSSSRNETQPNYADYLVTTTFTRSQARALGVDRTSPKQGRDSSMSDFVDPSMTSNILSSLKKRETKKKVKENEEVYCVCRQPFFGIMVCCDSCDEWFHIECVGLTQKEADAVDHWECHTCLQKKTVKTEDQKDDVMSGKDVKKAEKVQPVKKPAQKTKERKRKAKTDDMPSKLPPVLHCKSCGMVCADEDSFCNDNCRVTFTHSFVSGSRYAESTDFPLPLVKVEDQKNDVVGHAEGKKEEIGEKMEESIEQNDTKVELEAHKDDVVGQEEDISKDSVGECDQPMEGESVEIANQSNQSVSYPPTDSQILSQSLVETVVDQVVSSSREEVAHYSQEFPQNADEKGDGEKEQEQEKEEKQETEEVEMNDQKEIEREKQEMEGEDSKEKEALVSGDDTVQQPTCDSSQSITDPQSVADEALDDAEVQEVIKIQSEMIELEQSKTKLSAKQVEVNEWYRNLGHLRTSRSSLCGFQLSDGGMCEVLDCKEHLGHEETVKGRISSQLEDINKQIERNRQLSIRIYNRLVERKDL
ncbi:hypothetical protein P9112_001726 [Eukaryota sp. TZLM1-RC]